jgi:uncharacterized membrane protein
MAAAIVLTGAPDANAELVVCADTGRTIEVALARWEKNRFVTRGWFEVAGKACRTVIERELHQGKYYLFARAKHGKQVWPAQVRRYRPICVNPSRDFRHREWSSLGPRCPAGFTQRRFEMREATTGRLVFRVGDTR